MAAPAPPAVAPPGLAEVLQDLGAQGPPPQGFLGFPAPVGGGPAAPQGPSTKHPYAFRRHPPSPPTLLFLATQRLLARFIKDELLSLFVLMSFSNKVGPQVFTKANICAEGVPAVINQGRP